MKYNKLVRDLVVEIIQREGKVVRSHIATDGEYWLALKEKLFEEVKEFMCSENPEELADIVEVIEAIVKTGKIKEEDVVREISRKAREKGRFDKRIILEEVLE